MADALLGLVLIVVAVLFMVAMCLWISAPDWRRRRHELPAVPAEAVAALLPEDRAWLAEHGWEAPATVWPERPGPLRVASKRAQLESRSVHADVMQAMLGHPARTTADVRRAEQLVDTVRRGHGWKAS